MTCSLLSTSILCHLWLVNICLPHSGDISLLKWREVSFWASVPENYITFPSTKKTKGRMSLEYWPISRMVLLCLARLTLSFFGHRTLLELPMHKVVPRDADVFQLFFLNHSMAHGLCTWCSPRLVSLIIVFFFFWLSTSCQALFQELGRVENKEDVNLIHPLFLWAFIQILQSFKSWQCFLCLLFASSSPAQQPTASLCLIFSQALGILWPSKCTYLLVYCPSPPREGEGCLLCLLL